MIKRDVAPIGDSIHVRKPLGASLQHAWDSLCSLRLPRPEGFSARPGTTDLSLFILEPTTPLGPVSYSTDTRRLYFYKAVFSDGAMAVMSIAGESLSLALRDRSLENSLLAIRGEARSRGGLESHSLCSVRTPLAKRTIADFFNHNRGLMALVGVIQKGMSGEAGGSRRLQLKGVEIDGWSHRSSSLPECIVERERERSTNLLMKFAWAHGEGHSVDTLL